MPEASIREIKNLDPNDNLSTFFEFVANNRNYPETVNEMISIALHIEESENGNEKSEYIKKFQELQKQL